MRSPLALVVGVFLLAAPLATRGRPWGFALLAVAAVIFAAALRSRRWSGASVALLIAAFATGATHTAALRPHVPRARQHSFAREVDGVLDRPCVTREGRQSCALTERDHTRVVLYFHGPFCDARPGDRVSALATITPIQPTLNEGRLGPGASFVRDGITERGESAACTIERRWPDPIALVRRGGAMLRRAFDQGIDSAFAPLPARRAKALLFGDDDLLEPDVTESFRNTGLSHLLAVSGAHVAIVAASLGWLARKLASRSRWITTRGLVLPVEAALSLPAVTLFVCATGEAPSAMRALVMASLALLARLTQRHSDGPSLLAMSALVTVALVPGWRDDIGWQLSIAASWALVSAHRADPRERADRGGPDDRQPSRAQRALGWLRDALIATARVSLLTAPIVAGMSGRVPLLGLLANVVAAPIGEVFSLPLVLGAALVATVSPALGALLAKPASWALAAMFAIPAHATRWPLASIECWPPTTLQTVAWLSIVAIALRARSARTLVAGVSLALVCVAALEIAHRHSAHPRGVLRLTAIDVGQGDALLVDLPDGEAMLVDAGGVILGSDPGARAVVPLLAMRRRRSLALVVASHPHPDHVNGLAAVFAWARVAELWDTRQVEQQRPAPQWLDTRNQVTRQFTALRGPESLCRGPMPFHGATIEVLAPCRPIGARDSANDASFVLRITYRNASLLLPGDLEAHGERALLGALAPVSVLKLGHHGSRTSSTDPWLRALRPTLAIASAGHPSPYDHPHPSVVERLAALGIPLRSTAQSGSITVTLFHTGCWESRDATAVLHGGECPERQHSVYIPAR